MRYKRHEPLRYEFAHPHDTTFYISRIKGTEQKSKPGKGVIINISPGGLRLKSSLDLPENEDIDLSFEIDIAGHTLLPEGTIVWKKSDGKHFDYGIEFNSEDCEKPVIAALKDLQRPPAES